MKGSFPEKVSLQNIYFNICTWRGKEKKEEGEWEIMGQGEEKEREREEAL